MDLELGPMREALTDAKCVPDAGSLWAQGHDGTMINSLVAAMSGRLAGP